MSFLLGEDVSFAGPASSSESVKDAVIERLRSRILSLERHAPRRGPWAATTSTSEEGARPISPQVSRREAGWQLVCAAADTLLPTGLAANALHEIKGQPSALHGASAA